MNIFSSVKTLLLKHIQTMEENKKDFVKDPIRDFTRKRKLSFSDTMMMLISMECGSIRSELLKFFDYSPETATTSAFIQQRDKLKPEAFEHLFYEFSAEFPSKTHKGYHLFAVDGSDVLIPVEGNEEYVYFAREDQRDYYQIHLSAVYDLLNNQYSAAYIEPRKGHDERKAFHQLFSAHDFPENSLFIFDRGYEGYPLIAHISSKKQFFLIRAKDSKPGGILKGLHLPQTPEFDFMFDKICVHKMRAKYSFDPDRYRCVHATHTPYFLNQSVKEYPLSFRIVRLRLDNGSSECLLTNLPQESFDIAALKELYRRRWGIETSFCQLKYTIGLLYFHSKKIEAIEQEIWARFILYNYSMIVTKNIGSRETHAKYSYKPNIANAVQVCRRFLKLCIDETSSDAERLISGVLLPIRPNRNHPRNRTTQRPRKFNYRVL